MKHPYGLAAALVNHQAGLYRCLTRPLPHAPALTLHRPCLSIICSCEEASATLRLNAGSGFGNARNTGFGYQSTSSAGNVQAGQNALGNQPGAGRGSSAAANAPAPATAGPSSSGRLDVGANNVRAGPISGGTGTGSGLITAGGATSGSGVPGGIQGTSSGFGSASRVNTLGGPPNTQVPCAPIGVSQVKLLDGILCK